MNNIDKGIVYVKEKSNKGFVWVALAIIFLFTAIPLMLYGLGVASYNGCVWISKRHERENIKLERKNTKLFLQQEIEDKKEINKQLKLANKNKQEVE